MPNEEESVKTNLDKVLELAVQGGAVPVRSYQKTSTSGKSFTVSAASRGAPGPKNGITNPGGALRTGVSQQRKANYANLAVSNAMGSTNPITVGSTGLGRTPLRPYTAAPKTNPAGSSSAILAEAKAASAGAAVTSKSVANQAKIATAQASNQAKAISSAAAVQKAQIAAKSAVAKAQASASKAASTAASNNSKAQAAAAKAQAASAKAAGSSTKVPASPTATTAKAASPTSPKSAATTAPKAATQPKSTQPKTATQPKAATQPKTTQPKAAKAAQPKPKTTQPKAAKTTQPKPKTTTPKASGASATTPKSGSGALSKLGSAAQVAQLLHGGHGGLLRGGRGGHAYLLRHALGGIKMPKSGKSSKSKSSAPKTHEPSLGRKSPNRIMEEHKALLDAAHLRQAHMTGKHHTPAGFHELIHEHSAVGKIKSAVKSGVAKLSVSEIVDLQMSLSKRGYPVKIDGKLSDELITLAKAYLKAVE